MYAVSLAVTLTRHLLCLFSRAVENDYEGGEFIGGEYFYHQKRQKREWTKEDQIYGMFNDSDDEGGGRRRRPKGSSVPLNTPVSFVSSGNKDVNKSVSEAEDKGESTSTRAGLGAETGAGAGLGFKKGGTQSGDQEMKDASDEEEVLPTAFGRR